MIKKAGNPQRLNNHDSETPTFTVLSLALLRALNHSRIPTFAQNESIPTSRVYLRAKNNKEDTDQQQKCTN